MANAGAVNQEAPERSILKVALAALAGSRSRRRNHTTRTKTEMPPATVRAGGISRERGA